MLHSPCSLLIQWFPTQYPDIIFTSLNNNQGSLPVKIFFFPETSVNSSMRLSQASLALVASVSSQMFSKRLGVRTLARQRMKEVLWTVEAAWESKSSSEYSNTLGGLHHWIALHQIPVCHISGYSSLAKESWNFGAMNQNLASQFSLVGFVVVVVVFVVCF